MISFGNLTTAQFKERYWQQKPLLVRSALAEPQSLITPESVFDLGQSGQCESRLIERNKAGQWKLRHGPIADLPKASSKTRWTILTQAVDTQVQAIAELMNQFRFAGDALLDDVMISYANDGGGVGPHVDSYDVFLIQLQGKRRWQICRDTNPQFIDGLPLKILQRFEPRQEWLLEPGDMLYLPVGWAHDGVAVGSAMTASIGFRAPSPEEWISAFLIDSADNLEQVMPSCIGDGRYKQTSQTAQARKKNKPADIGSDLTHYLSHWVAQLTLNPDQLAKHAAEFSGRYLTEPKATTIFSVPIPALNFEKFVKKIKLKGVKTALGTRMLYRANVFFINGESFTVNRQQLKLLASFANHKALAGIDCAAAPPDVLESVHDWYLNGWVTASA